MKTTKYLLLFSVFTFLFNAGCMYAVRYDGTYRGKVVEADTGAPIEGAVVLGTWHTVTPTVAGGVSRYYDARETVTDINGEFSIRGMGLRFMSNLEPMHFLIFKSGYEYSGSALWESLKLDILLRQKIKWEGSKPIIPLKKLTMEERKKQGTPDFYIGERYNKKENMTHSCLPKNIKLLPKEVNKESLEQGLKPYDFEGGRCDK